MALARFLKKLKEGEVVGVFTAACREKSDIYGRKKVAHVSASLFGTFTIAVVNACLGMGAHCHL